MNLQPFIELLTSRIADGDILTPSEMKEFLTVLTGIKLSGKLISEEKIQSVAFGAAHSVCDTGEINSRRHNAAVIAQAIRDALK
jgi:hypothetical protein